MDNHPDPAREALAAARQIARGSSRPGRRRRRGGGDGDGTPRRGGYSGPRPDDTDPQQIGALLSGYVTERGWERPLQSARIFADWTGLVGADVAAHCRPIALSDGQLRITAESTAWATQLRLLSGTLLARLNDELGVGVVHRLQITGPVGPSWKHGPLSVPGARGPRDTYG